MTNVQMILVRSYYAEHGSLLGIENADFYKRVFKGKKPSEDELVEMLGVKAESMRPATKLAMIEGLSRGDIASVCDRLGVKTKKECWDLAHFEGWRGVPVAFKKLQLSAEEEALLNYLTVYLTLNKRSVVLLGDPSNPKVSFTVGLRQRLYRYAVDGGGKIPKEGIDLLKGMIPKYQWVEDLPVDFLASGQKLYSRIQFSKESLRKVLAVLPEHIAYRGAYLTHSDYSRLITKIALSIFEPTFVYLIGLSCSWGCTIERMMEKLGFQWLNAIEDFRNLDAILVPRGTGMVTVVTKNSKSQADFVVLEEEIVKDLARSRQLGSIAWNEEGAAFFDVQPPILLRDIYVEGAGGNEFKSELP